MRKKYLLWLIGLATNLTLALAGCGGGGGGGSDGAASSAPLTQENAEVVAGRVVASVGALEGASSLGSGLTGIGGGFLGRRTAGLTMQMDDQACPGGGTMSVTINMALAEVFSTSDSVSADFSGCRFSPEETMSLNGGVTFLVTQASGNPNSPPFDFTLAYDFDSLQASAPGESTVGIDGGFSARLRSNDGISHDATVTASSVRVSDGANWITLSGYVFDATHNEDTGEFEVAVTGTLRSAALGGAVSFDTLIPLTGIGDFPSAGEVLITGAESSSILVRVLAENAVELQVDEDGDGIVDVVITTTWETLES